MSSASVFELLFKYQFLFSFIYSTSDRLNVKPKKTYLHAPEQMKMKKINDEP